MKLKYYLRGLGIGIIVTTLILMIAGTTQKTELTDAEIIEKAETLGMVMDTESTIISDEQETETQVSDTESSTEISTETDTETEQTGTSETEENTTDGAADTTDTSVQNVDESNTDAEQGTYHLAVDAGEVCRQVCEELQANGVIENSEDFRKYLSEAGYANQIQPGDYEVSYGMTFEELAQLLITRQ